MYPNEKIMQPSSKSASVTCAMLCAAGVGVGLVSLVLVSSAFVGTLATFSAFAAAVDMLACSGRAEQNGRGHARGESRGRATRVRRENAGAGGGLGRPCAGAYAPNIRASGPAREGCRGVARRALTRPTYGEARDAGE